MEVGISERPTHCRIALLLVRCLSRLPRDEDMSDARPLVVAEGGVHEAPEVIHVTAFSR